MSLPSLRVLAFVAFASALAAPVFAQQGTPPPSTPPPAGTATTPTPAQSAADQAATAARAKAEAEATRDDLDRFYSLEASYWQIVGHPILAGGAAFSYAEGSVLDYTGSNKDGFSGSLIVPLPAHADLKFDYFRFAGNGSQTLSALGTEYFDVAYAQGDYLSPSYTAQGAKLTYEYLSLPWPVEKHKTRLYTLWSMEYFNMKTVIDAPYKSTTDSSGNTVATTASGGRMIIYPMFGLKGEYQFSKSLRLEASASGFGFPGHAAIWDADANASVRLRHNLELVLGVRAFYFKTSPRSDEYFHDLPYGGYGGIRYILR